jgi:hypothetical protein
MLGHRKTVFTSHQKKLGEQALHMGKPGRAAKEPHVTAQIAVPGSALDTVSTGVIRINGDPITRFHIGDVRADGDNQTGAFVAEDHRFSETKISNATFSEVMQI